MLVGTGGGQLRILGCHLYRRLVNTSLKVCSDNPIDAAKDPKVNHGIKRRSDSYILEAQTGISYCQKDALFLGG